VTRNTVADQVLRALHDRPEGMSDAELARMLDKIHQHINQVCNRLASQGKIIRDSTSGGIINRIRNGTPRPSADIRPNRKNIYVRDADLAVWERAEQLAGAESISALISRLLGNYVTHRETVEGRIVVELQARDGNVTRKAFRGRWLVEHFESGDPAATTATQYFAAQGERGGLALWRQSRDGDHADARSFSTYGSLGEAAGERWPQDFLSAVASALDEEYAEEIDL
jgi:hypothetical protein